MAIQNFISGGYYGKLGMTVGQRWKNKRTMRVYVIPADPKTPKQQAQRKRFGNNVAFAQAAMLSNYNSNFFVSESLPQWNIRMSIAATLFKSYDTFLSKLPLIPVEKSAPYTITRIGATVDETTRICTIKIEGTLPANKRQYCIYATNNRFTEELDDVLLMRGESTDENPDTITTNPIIDFEIDENTYLRIVSVDDENSEVDMVLSAELKNEPDTRPVVDFDTSIKSVVVSEDTTTITFNQGVLTGVKSASVSQIHGLLSYEYVTIDNPSCVLTDDGTNMQLLVTQDDYAENNQIAYNSNGFVKIEKIRVETEDTIYQTENSLQTITESGVITRLFNNIETVSVAVNDNIQEVTLRSDKMNYLIPPATVATNCDRMGVVSIQNFNITKVSISDTEAIFKLDIPLPDGQTRNQYGGYAIAQNDARGYGMPPFQSIMDDVRYRNEASYISSRTGSYNWNFTPNFTNEDNTNNICLLSCDVYIPNWTLISAQGYFKADTNENGITPKTYSNTITPKISQNGNYIKIRYPNTTTPKPVQIGCYALTPKCKINSDYASYTLNAKNSIPIKNNVTTYDISNAMSRCSNFVATWTHSGSGASIKISNPVTWLIPVLQNTIGNDVIGTYLSNVTMKPFFEFWDASENPVRNFADDGFSIGYQDNKLLLTWESTLSNIPQGTEVLFSYSDPKLDFSVGAGDFLSLSYGGNTVTYTLGSDFEPRKISWTDTDEIAEDTATFRG